MKNFFKIIRNNCFMLKYVLKYTPGLVIYNFIYYIYSGFVRTFTGVYVAMFILDSFQNKRPINEVLVFLVMVLAANVLQSVIQAYLAEIYSLKQQEILYQKMQSELFEKARNMELACYDNPSFYNDFVWAMSQSDGKALAVLDNTGQFLQHLTRFGSTVGIIISIDSVGVYAAAFIEVLCFFIRIIANKLEFELSEKQIPLQRKRDYISRVIYLADYAKEIRLSNVKKKLIEDFSSSNKKLVQVIRHYGKKLMATYSIRVISRSLILNVYTGYLVYLVLVAKTITYGGFMGLYNGTQELGNSAYSMGEVLTRFQKDSLYIDRFRTFLEYKSKMQDGQEPVPETKEVTLEMKNVSFQYEGTEEPTLHNINLTLHPGEKVALVGYNGAGKSTLVKLLMRLYDVTEGSIELNGSDIRNYALEDYYNCFGVVFQDFKLFAASIAENVMMDKVKPEDEAAVLEALEKSDFAGRLETLEDGTSTVLTREFSKEGVNLSGGEAQKVAIARVFPRNSRIVILDEPSSSLDPVTEYYVNQTMMNAAKDKTIVYISHRLSTTKMADRIIMLEKGRIIEEGTHDQLMELDGKYAEMFHMQAEKYGG